MHNLMRQKTWTSVPGHLQSDYPTVLLFGKSQPGDATHDLQNGHNSRLKIEVTSSMKIINLSMLVIVFEIQVNNI